MTADWLYPLSSNTNYYFKSDTGRTVDTGPSSFEQMLLRGARDDVWGVYKNWRNMRKGDRVWVYYGVADGELGVVGLATVTDVKPPAKPGQRANAQLRWDRKATLRLLANPVPAAQIRRYIPRPQAAVWAVPAPLAQRLLLHSRAKARTTTNSGAGAGSRYGKAKASSVSYTPPKSVTVNRRHDALLRPFETRLESAGWVSHPFKIGSKSADLVVRRKNQLLLIEAKTVSQSTTKPVREAFAQLAEYSWRYRQAAREPLPVTMWALFESELATDEVRFLEDNDIRVTWASHSMRRFIHGPNTAKKAPKVGL